MLEATATAAVMPALTMGSLHQRGMQGEGGNECGAQGCLKLRRVGAGEGKEMGGVPQLGASNTQREDEGMVAARCAVHSVATAPTLSCLP